jgi:hypothetical protein
MTTTRFPSELVSVPSEAASLDIEQHVLRFEHSLHERDAFTDAALARLIESHPRGDVHIHHMSGSSESPRYADATLGAVTGEEALVAIRRGKLWMSLVHIERHHVYDELLRELYDGLEGQCRLRTLPASRLANLLISSPTAEVFYHADAQHTALWHIRGEKRLLVYPPWDERCLSQANRELCLLGMLVDDVYSDDYDRLATVIEMKPGDAATWPHSTPHRVVNMSGLNVSLSSEHHTRASYRRRQVAAANWYFRNRLGLPMRSLEIGGLGASSKVIAFRAIRGAAKLFGRGALVPEDPDVEPTIRLDPKDPRGYTELGDA